MVWDVVFKVLLVTTPYTSFDYPIRERLNYLVIVKIARDFAYAIF